MIALKFLFEGITSRIIKEQHGVKQTAQQFGISDIQAINWGWCELWATYARQISPRAKFIRIRQTGSCGRYHCVIKISNRYYDSETYNGVANWRDLPWVKRDRGERFIAVALGVK